MNLYFSKVDISWQAKNKAQEQTQHMIMDMDRCLIKVEDLQAVKDEIINRVSTINRNNPRSTDLDLHIWQKYGDTDKDVVIEILGVFKMVVYKVHEEYGIK